MVNDFHLEAKPEIESDYTSGNVPAGIVASHRAKSTNQRPIVKPSYNWAIELSMPQGDSRPRAMVQAPSPFHPAIANAQPIFARRAILCTYTPFPWIARKRRLAVPVVCTMQGEGQETCERDHHELLKKIADDWKRSDPECLGRYHWPKAGTVDENKNWVGEARKLGGNYPIEKGYTVPVKRKAGDQLPGSRQKRRMTDGGRILVEESSNEEESGRNHSQPSPVRNHPKRFSNASQNIPVAPDSSSTFDPLLLSNHAPTKEMRHPIITMQSGMCP